MASLCSGPTAQFRFRRVQVFRDECLGSGAYGSVFKAKCDELPCAAKTLHSYFLKTSDQNCHVMLDKFEQECQFLLSIRHPNIVQCLDVNRDPKTGQFTLLMELMDENLTSFLARYGAENSVPFHLQVNLSRDVCLALNYLHDNGIIHRDLSSNNVLLLAGCRAKITDLGVSKLKDALQNHMTRCPGSPVYMPPEALQVNAEYTEELDMFSFGVLLLQIITTKSPNPDAHEISIADAEAPNGFISHTVKEVDRRRAHLALVPEDHPFRGMIFQCIDDIPMKRPSSKQLCQRLEGMSTSAEYGHSLSSTNSGSTIAAVPIADSTELETLKSDLRRCQEVIRQQEVQLNQASDTADPSAKGVAESFSNGMSHSSEEVRVVRGLNPDLVSLLGKNKAGELSGVVYNRPEQGAITITRTSMETLSSRISLVLSTYQGVANSSQQSVDMIHLASDCSKQEAHAMVDAYNKRFRHCYFSYIEDVHLIHMFSLFQAEARHAKQKITEEMHLTVHLPGGRKLFLRKGDIVKQDTCAIVNSANSRLVHGGGVAWALNKASHSALGEASKRYVQEHGEVPEGQVAVTTGGGDLKCKWVIHAVSPSYTKKRTAESCKRLMCELVENVLCKAEELGVATIALPPLGTGNNKIKVDIAGSAIISAVLDHPYKQNDSLREIRVVIIDDQTFVEFSRLFAGQKSEESFSSSFVSSSADNSTSSYCISQ